MSFTDPRLMIPLLFWRALFLAGALDVHRGMPASQVASDARSAITSASPTVTPTSIP